MGHIIKAVAYLSLALLMILCVVGPLALIKVCVAVLLA